ncbi:MAG: hypothetical protein WCF30_20540 [Terracidiphilus sp.]
MELLIALFWVSTMLAILSFLIFAAFATQRYVEVQSVAKRFHPVQREGKAMGGMDTGLQSLADPDKVIEALAKLTDSLSKAPMSVAALIAAMFFMLIALGASALECKSESKPPDGVKTSLIMQATPCVVGYFGDGRHQLPSTIDDSPHGCLSELAERLRRERPGLLLIIGRCDIREMTPKTSKIYGSNLSLAYQRALSVRQYLLEPKPGTWPAASDEMAVRVIPLVGGASHIGRSVDPALLREDRVVELTSFWVQAQTTP